MGATGWQVTRQPPQHPAANWGFAKPLSTPKDASGTTARRIPSYCTLRGLLATVSRTAAISRCEATHQQFVVQAHEIWPTTGTQMTPTQIVAKFMAEAGRPGTAPTAVYDYKTTFGGAGKLMTTGNNPVIAPSTPAYIVTTHWSTGSVDTTLVDAISGEGTTGCTGCDIVQPDGTVIKTPAIH